MRKVKCFSCHKFSHYVKQCPNKKKGIGKTTETTCSQMDELANKFEKELSLVSCLYGTITRGVWFVDNGVSHHMMGSCDIFTNMAKGHRDLHVKLGDNIRYAVKCISNIQFQLDSGSLMEVKEVMYVPGLENNLLSFSAMEDGGLEVNFIGGEVVVRPKGVNPSARRVIGSGKKNLYLLRG